MKMNNIDIGMEMGIVLQISFLEMEKSYKARLVGMERENYLILRIPPIPNIWMQLKKENFTVVRYIHDGKVYGFHSTLLVNIEDPINLLILSYPGNIETVNLRKTERCECLIPIQILREGNTYPGIIRDISPRGCRLVFNMDTDSTDNEYSVGQELLLSIQLSGIPADKKVKVEVKNIRKENQKIMLGTSFRELDDEIRKGFEKYMELIEEFTQR